VPTHNLSLLAGTGNLVAIDSIERVGAPMTPDQIHERMRQRQPDEVIVYQLGDVRPPPVQLLPPVY
jgi:hypothetical protein